MPRRTLSTLAVAAWLLATASAASAAPPSNDDFERAAPLDGTVSGTFDEATRQENEPPHGAQTVWYAYRAARSERVAVHLVRTINTSAVFTVYTGQSLTALREVGSTRTSQAPRMPFEAVAGETYWVAVAPPYEGISTSFDLRVEPAPVPANDAFADAERIRVPSRHVGSLLDASGQRGERIGGSRPTSSVWYRFRAGRTGPLTVDVDSDTCASAALYTGNSISRLRPVKARVTDALRFTARRGKTYRVAVYCFGPGGEFELTVSDGSIAGKGVEASVDAGQTVDGIRNRGLRATVRTKRRVSLDLALVVSRSSARRLGLGDHVLGRTTLNLGSNAKRHATVRLTAAARRALAGRTSFRGVLRLTLRDPSAPDRVLNVPVRLPN